MQSADARQVEGMLAFVAEDGRPGFSFQHGAGTVSLLFSPQALPDLRQLVGALEAMVSAGKTGIVY